MYYRVKKFSDSYSNMFVLDKDADLNKLKARTSIDCSGLGLKSFINPVFIESQQVKCVSMSGSFRNSDIIEE